MEPYSAARPKTEEKKDFTPEEHDRAKAVCEFVIELIKAISRSGYYDADHPVSLDVKKGLYDHFKKVLGPSSELMLTCHNTEEGADIHISGILSEPFNIRKLTHATTSDLFVPKLKDYFERKSLNSFVVKKSITPEHFEAFIDVMSEPIADSADPSKLGEYLTRELAERNITEISTVFKTDIVLSRGKLPWRVSIILRRLAKDLKVIPLFRQASEEKIKLIKKQIVEDIIRPLNNSGLLRDLIVNCDIIVEHVHHLMEVDELETTMVNALPVNELLPVSLAVYDFYRNYLKESETETSGFAADQRRIFLEKMLQIAAKKMIRDKTPDIAGLLDGLYEDRIVSYDDLPEEFRFKIETKKLAEDILNRPEFYLDGLEKTSADEAKKLLGAFQRTMAQLIIQKEWSLIDKIIQKTEALALQGRAPLESDLILPDYLFESSCKVFAEEYVRCSTEERKSMNAVMSRLHEISLKIADDILNVSKEPDVLKNMVDLLSQKGKLARTWAIQALENQTQSLALLNLALLVLQNVGEEGDFHVMEKYIKYPNHSIRNRALAVAARLNKKEAERYVVDALTDDHELVREHAVAIFERDLIPSELTANKIVMLVKAKLQKNKDLSEKDALSLAAMIRTIARNTALVNNHALESDIIGMTSEMWKGKSGVLKFIKAEPTAAEKEIVSACLLVLGKIGTEKTADFLNAFSKGAGALGAPTLRALEEINRRKKAG